MKTKRQATKSIHCEGWIHTPAFALGGLIGWYQCENSAIWQVTFKRGKKKQTLPACNSCLKRLRAGEDQDGAVIIKTQRIKTLATSEQSHTETGKP